MVLGNGNRLYKQRPSYFHTLYRPSYFAYLRAYFRREERKRHLPNSYYTVWADGEIFYGGDTPNATVYTDPVYPDNDRDEDRYDDDGDDYIFHTSSPQVPIIDFAAPPVHPNTEHSSSTSAPSSSTTQTNEIQPSPHIDFTISHGTSSATNIEFTTTTKTNRIGSYQFSC
jgi:hypothetical protein